MFEWIAILAAVVSAIATSAAAFASWKAVLTSKKISELTIKQEVTNNFRNEISSILSSIKIISDFCLSRITLSMRIENSTSKLIETFLAAEKTKIINNISTLKTLVNFSDEYIDFINKLEKITKSISNIEYFYEESKKFFGSEYIELIHEEIKHMHTIEKEIILYSKNILRSLNKGVLINE